MALRLGEKALTGIAKGTLIDPDVRKGEVLVHPEVVPPVGPVTKIIIITSDSAEILHGTIKLEEKHETKTDGTSLQYWTITEKNLVGDGFVKLQFNQSCQLRYKRTYGNNSATGTLLYGTDIYVSAKDFEDIIEIKPWGTKTEVVFKAEEYTASELKTPAGWHNGITINEDGTSLTFAPGLVGAFDIDRFSMPWHGEMTYSVSYSRVPQHIYMVWSDTGSSDINPSVTLATDIMNGYDHHRLVAIVTFGDDRKIASVQDMREVCTYDVTYSFNYSSASRWEIGARQYLYQKISDTRYAAWSIYVDLTLNPTYTNEVVPAVLKDIPAKINVPVADMQKAFGNGEWLFWQAPIIDLLQEAFGGTAMDAKWKDVGLGTDYRVLSYTVSGGKVTSGNSQISSGTMVSGIGVIKDTSVRYYKGLGFDGTIGRVMIRRPATMSTSVSWKDNITWEADKVVGRITITPFPTGYGSATGNIYLYGISHYINV